MRGYQVLNRKAGEVLNLVQENLPNRVKRVVDQTWESRMPNTAVLHFRKKVISLKSHAIVIGDNGQHTPKFRAGNEVDIVVCLQVCKGVADTDQASAKLNLERERERFG